MIYVRTCVLKVKLQSVDHSTGLDEKEGREYL
jgi:hypothetical protein